MKGITRRDFVKSAGLTLAVAATPWEMKLFALGKADIGVSGLKPGTWVQITPDNLVTVFVNKSEMGQGVHTSIPMIVADELDADWKQVRIQMSPVTQEYADPVMKAHGTYGSTTTVHMYEPLRKVGAAGREMLIRAAAKQWNVPASECEAALSRVHHRSSGKSLSFGELAESAASLPIPENPRLKEKSEFTLMGTSVPRLDIPEKVQGRAQFGIDTFVPGMLYGVVARPTAYGAELTASDQKSVEQVPGVRQVVKVSRGIGIVGDTLEACWKGRSVLAARWVGGSRPSMDTSSEDQLLKDSLAKKGVSASNEGNLAEAFQKGAKRVQADYLVPYLSHAVMEPMNSTAHVQADQCDVWTPTQSQSGVLGLAARISGLTEEQINIHTTYLGGGYGRRGGTFVVMEALELSKATGRPVKVIWTREEDMKDGAYRPGVASRNEASLDKDGRITGWSQRVASTSVMEGLRGGRPGGPPADPFAMGGIRDLQYQVPNLSTEYVRVESPIPVRTWRAPSGSHAGFTVENFMDELAHAAGQDPVEFRLKHLEHDPRAHRLLKMVADKADWGREPKIGEAKGAAIFYSHGTYVAEVAEVSVDRKTGVITVHRVVCGVDCGPIVNRDTVVAQMEGALTMGLSAALKEKLQFSEGGVKTNNFLDYPILRMSEAPVVEVHIMESDAEVGGAGEPSLPPIAPAVANAVFAATGVRLRTLPMTPDRVLAELKNS